MSETRLQEPGGSHGKSHRTSKGEFTGITFRLPEAPPPEVLRCFQWNRPPHSWSADGSALGSRAHDDQPSLSQGGHHFAEAGAQVIYLHALREQNPVHRSLRWNGYWALL